jgi:hypothetical protein
MTATLLVKEVHDREPERSTDSRRRRASFASYGLFCLAWVLWGYGIASTNLANAQGSWGLVPALPWSYYLGLALMLVSFAIHLMRPEPSGKWLGVHVASIAFMMQAPMPLLYSEPRFFWNFQAVGEINYLAHAGHLQLNADINQRFPSFYGLGAWFDTVAGIRSPLYYMKWFPVGCYMLFVWAFWFAARALPITKRALWLAVCLLVVSDWYLGAGAQNTLTPQAPAFFLALIVLGLILRQRKSNVRPSTSANEPRALPRRWVRGGTHRQRRPRPLDQVKQWWYWLGRDPGTSGQQLPPGQERNSRGLSRWAYPLDIAIAITIYLAIVTGHPLTPMIVILECGVLLVLNRLKPFWILLVFATIFGIYVLPNLGFLSHSVGAFRGLGQVASNVTVPHGGGLSQVGPTKYTLPLLVAFVGILALVGMIRSRREWRTVLLLLALAGAPVFIIGLVHYGGETTYRAFMFADPWLCCLGALAILGSPSREASLNQEDSSRSKGPQSASTKSSVVVCSICVLVLLPLTSLVMISSVSQNEIYEVDPGDVRAALWLSEHTKPGPAIYLDNNFPLSIGSNYADYLVGKVNGYTPEFLSVTGPLSGSLSNVVPGLTQYACGIQRGRPGYLVLSEDQYKFAKLFGYVTRGSYEQLLGAVRSSGSWKQRFANESSAIFENVSTCKPSPRASSKPTSAEITALKEFFAAMIANGEHVISSTYQPVTGTRLYLSNRGGVYAPGGGHFYGSVFSLAPGTFIGRPVAIRALSNGGYAIINQYGQTYNFGPAGSGSDYAEVLGGRGTPS